MKFFTSIMTIYLGASMATAAVISDKRCCANGGPIPPKIGARAHVADDNHLPSNGKSAYQEDVEAANSANVLGTADRGNWAAHVGA